MDEPVLGIGGVFFRSPDPARLGSGTPTTLASASRSGVGPSFGRTTGTRRSGRSSQSADTSYWPAGQQAMVNYRVRDLDAVLSRLRAAGVEFGERVEETENGRFGWALDPEGNRFELWQPPA